MAFTTEQQAAFDIQKEINTLNQTHQVQMELKRSKLEAVRLAKEVLTENRRSLPVGEREVTASEITTFADTIINYVNN